MRRVVSTITLPISLSGGTSGGGGGGGGAMVGVTFQNIDGGSTYYASSGFTFPASFPAAIPNGGVSIAGGWDSPLFFPLGGFLLDFRTTLAVDYYIGRNQNVAFGTLAGTFVTNNSYASSHNMSMIAFCYDPPLGPIGNETVGLIGQDEPQVYFQANAPSTGLTAYVYEYINTTPSVSSGATHALGQDGRFWHFQGTHNQFDSDAFGMTDAPLTSYPEGGAKATLLTPIPTPSLATKLPAAIFSFDLYWTSYSRLHPPFLGGPFQGVMCFTSTPTVDQQARCSWYGDMVDYNRRLTHFCGLDIPLFQIVEVLNSGAGIGSSSDSINSLASLQEANWGIWSSVIHGARGICAFEEITDPFNPVKPFTPTAQGTTLAVTVAGSIATVSGAGVLTVSSDASITGGTYQNNIPFGALLHAGSPSLPANTYILAQLTNTSGTYASGGAGTYLLSTVPGTVSGSWTAEQALSSGAAGSLDAQITQTGKQLRDMAPIINSQFANGYAWVSPAGYLFPHATLQIPAIGSGAIELMVKKYTGTAYTTLAGDLIDTNKFYIFACTRNSQQTQNTVATFHIADFGATTVTVLSDGVVAARTINITTPGQFQDTFEYCWTVRVYKVNGPQTGALPTTKTIILTASSTNPWVVPPDWNPANANSFELIGGGGGGSSGEFHGGGSGGGGAEYRKLTNQGSTHFQPGDSINYTVGSGGAGGVHLVGTGYGSSGAATFIKDRTGTTLVTANPGISGTNWFGAITPTSGAGGTGGSGGTGFFGGTAPAAVGSAHSFMGSSGGGAGGPNGNGANGFYIASGNRSGGSGGGAASGGTVGFSYADGGAIGGQGGMNTLAYGGGAGGQPRTNGDSGFWGGGGGGGGICSTSGVAGNGGAGGAGIEWTSNPGGVQAGAGGGGGSGGGNDGINGTAGNGGNGGLYGGGGGGAPHAIGATGWIDGDGGAGAAGVIVITYQP